MDRTTFIEVLPFFKKITELYITEYFDTIYATLVIVNIVYIAGVEIAYWYVDGKEYGTCCKC